MIDTAPLTRYAESFGYAREIQQPWGGLQNVLDWCKTEITDGTWCWQLIEISNGVDPGQYIFYFDSDRDCCAFALKWG